VLGGLEFRSRPPQDRGADVDALKGGTTAIVMVTHENMQQAGRGGSTSPDVMYLGELIESTPPESVHTAPGRPPHPGTTFSRERRFLVKVSTIRDHNADG